MTADTGYFAKNLPLIHQLATKRLKMSLAVFAALLSLIPMSFFGQSIIESDDLFTAAGPIIGGDFMVFHFAARVAGKPEMLAIYEMANLKAMLEAAHPGRGAFNFGWMYPPTMSLVISPFALQSYLASYALWAAAFGTAFFFTLYRLWPDKWALHFVATSPAVFQAFITGQTGFLTATLIMVAGAFADKRPLLAGIAAGLLTIKPQLGILIPIAFLAGGCWRAAAAAAVTATLLALASLLAYGPAAWAAFGDSLSAYSGLLGTTGFLNNKLVTPFGFATMLGAPREIASGLQIAASIALAVYVAVVWRRVKDWDLRLAALSTAAILATPYALYYEIVIAAPAMMLVARRAVQTGWLRYERLTLIAAWIIPLQMPGASAAPAIPTCAIGGLVAFLIVARRVLPAANFMCASAKATAPAGS